VHGMSSSIVNSYERGNNLARCRTAQHTKMGSILILSRNKFMPHFTNSLIRVGLCK
jgi:hypothetical protein